MIGRQQHAEAARPILGEVPRLVLRCGSDLGVLAATRPGVGIGYCQAGIGGRDPDLVRVLPDLVLARVGTWLVMHEALRSTCRVRALSDRHVEEMGQYAAAPHRAG